VIAQVAISFVLVAGSLLLGRSFQELRAVAPGFDPAAALTYRVSLAGERYADPAARVRFFQSVNESLRGLDPIAHAGGVSMLPFTRGYAWTDFRVEGQEVVDARDRIVADLHIVTPDYFEALGAGVVAGRTFTSADGRAESVVMVNRAFAERFWGAREAVGKWAGRDHVEEKATIVGVVETVRQYGLVAESRPAVYYPHAMFPSRSLYGVVRVRGDEPAAMAAVVKAAVHKLDPELPVYDVRTMGARIASSLARERLLMTLVGLFGAVALVVAAVGLYGVLAFVVASHTHEIGVRKSLGARTIDLYRLVLGGAARTVVVGAAIGLLTVAAMARAVAGILHGVSSTDPLALAAALAIVLAISITAAVVPARRAARVDPMVALRME
jgi:putative ABC transport system permease protein